MPVLPATSYLRSFRGLGRTCIIDLNAGASTAPVEMLGDDTQMDLPRPQFPPGGVEVLPSTLVTLMSDDSRRRGCAGNGHSPGEKSITDLGFPWASYTPGEMCAAELDFPRASFPPRELCGRTGLHKAGFIGRIASVCVDSDWVTPLRISPQTCTGLFPIDVALSSAV